MNFFYCEESLSVWTFILTVLKHFLVWSVLYGKLYIHVSPVNPLFFLHLSGIIHIDFRLDSWHFRQNILPLIHINILFYITVNKYPLFRDKLIIYRSSTKKWKKLYYSRKGSTFHILQFILTDSDFEILIWNFTHWILSCTSIRSAFREL